MTEQPINVSLVIPCFNESTRLTLMFQLIEEFREKWMGDTEVILVDDGSSDHTIEIIENHPYFQDAAQNGSFDIIKFPHNKGKGSALMAGVEKAKYGFLLTLDADMSMSPMELFRWKKIKGGEFDSNEILIASRELEESTVNTVQTRKFAGRVFNFIVRFLTPLRIKDTQCGFKFYPSKIAKPIFSNLKEAGWAHDVELLYRAKKRGFTIREMPVSVTQFPGSKVRLIRDSIKMLIQILKISLLVRFEKKLS